MTFYDSDSLCARLAKMPFRKKFGEITCFIYSIYRVLAAKLL